LGILMGWGSLHFLTSLLQQRLPQAIAIHLDARILVFALLLSLATGLVFGMAPVVQLLRGNLHDRLKQGGRQTAGGGQRLRHVLVVSEIAISLVLLAAAGLLLRSMVSLLNVDKGFNSHHVVTMAVRPSPVRYKDPKTEILYLQRILASVKLPARSSVRRMGLYPSVDRQQYEWRNQNRGTPWRLAQCGQAIRGRKLLPGD